MGERLLLYFKYIEEMRGVEGKLRLAQSTKMPSNKAALEPDTKENIDRFREAVQKITGKEAPVY